MRPAATILLLVLLAPLSFAETHILFDGFGASWAPRDGGAVTELLAPPIRSDGAFDGERDLLVWYASDGVRFGIFDEGATGTAFRGRLDDAFDDAHPPVAVWDGSRFLVFWTSDRAHVAAVSPQGVVMQVVTLADVPSIDDAATNGNTIALVRQFSSDTHSGNVELILLDRNFATLQHTTIGSIVKSAGGGITYLRQPRVVAFGSGYYAAWIQTRTSRYEEVVGTRIASDGTPLDVVPSTRELQSLMGTPLETMLGAGLEIFDLELVVHRSRVLAIMKREWGFQVTASAVDASGALEGPLHVAGKQMLPINATTIVRADGSLALAWFDEYAIATVQPFTALGSAPPRRRATRH